MNQSILIAIAVLVCLFTSPWARAENSKPSFWEYGIGIGALNLPDYIGAHHRQSAVFPIPYLIYRGERLTIDREGATSDLIKTRRMRFYLSLGVGVLVSSGQNGPREGMPELYPSFEAGPALQIYLGENRTDHIWSVRLPVRAVMATDFKEYEKAGWVFAPDIHLESKTVLPGWEISLSAGPVYGSDRYHDYFYEVLPQYATASRPVYDPTGGFGGYRTGFTLRKRYPEYWLGMFVRYYNLSGATFQESPLVETRHGLMVGVGISLILATSQN